MFHILDGKECFRQIPRESKGNGMFCRAYFGAFQQLSARKLEAGSHCPPLLSQKLKVRNQSGQHTDSLVWLSCKSVHVFTSIRVSQIPGHWAWHFSEGNCTYPVDNLYRTYHEPITSFWTHFYHRNESNCHLPRGWSQESPTNLLLASTLAPSLQSISPHSGHNDAGKT